MYTGLTAKITVMDGENEKVIGYISNWSVEETRDTVEVTQLGKMEKEVRPALYSWTASAEGAADFTDAKSQKYLREAMCEKDKPVTVKFYLSDTEYLTGSAYVTSFSTDISAEDKGNVSISLTGTGSLTYTDTEAAAE